MKISSTAFSFQVTEILFNRTVNAQMDRQTVAKKTLHLPILKVGDIIKLFIIFIFFLKIDVYPLLESYCIAQSASQGHN